MRRAGSEGFPSHRVHGFQGNDRAVRNEIVVFGITLLSIMVSRATKPFKLARILFSKFGSFDAADEKSKPDSDALAK